MDSTVRKIDALIKNISALPGVRSVGISGGELPFPKPGEGDIDIFIYCDSIPAEHVRKQVLKGSKERTAVFEGGYWGVGDFTLVNGVETWLMYFTVEETIEEINSVLSGKRLEKEDNYYYPTGRCEMLRNMWIRFDADGFLSCLKTRLSEYPESLSVKMLNYHLEKLEDTEDLKRAVSRKDVLFYHFAFDIAADHFLQALFALNRAFFPSRKRSFQYISDFRLKPDRCEELLSKAVRLGGSAETLGDSYSIFESLCKNLKLIAAAPQI